MNVAVRSRSAFHLYLAAGFLAVALAGFSTTFFFPLAKGTFTAPAVVYVHGAVLFSWLLLFITQAAMARSGNLRFHRRAGWVGALLAMAVVVTGILVGLFAARRDLAASGESWPFGDFVTIVIEMLVFGSLVTAAVLTRGKPEFHKRFLILATISVLGPAWFRFRHFMPFVPHPLVTFSIVADSVLLSVMARDWRVQGRVHPVYLWAGGAMVAVHAIELTASRSQAFLSVGRWLIFGVGQGNF